MQAPKEFLLFKITIFKRCLLILLAGCIASFVFRQGAFALGFFMGSLISMAIFSLLYRYILAAKDFSPRQRKKFLIPKALLIYVIMGITLFIAIKKGLPVFLGCAAGLLSLKIAIFAEAFKRKQCQLTN